MKFEKNQETDKKKSFLKSKCFAIMATAILLMPLTSCGPNWRGKNQKLNIYQPSTLRLKKQHPIETIDGVYTPQLDEVWHSDARFRKLEREILHDKN